MFLNKCKASTRTTATWASKRGWFDGFTSDSALLYIPLYSFIFIFLYIPSKSFQFLNFQFPISNFFDHVKVFNKALPKATAYGGIKSNVLFYHIPIPDLLRNTSLVYKRWHSIIAADTFSTYRKNYFRYKIATSTEKQSMLETLREGYNMGPLFTALHRDNMRDRIEIWR